MGTRTPQDRLDNSRRLGDPLVRREQAPKARAVSPPGGRLGLTSGDPRQHRRDRPRREPDERTDGPEPGHLTARSARRRREAGRALGRRAIGTGAPGECRGRPRVNARAGWPKASSAGAEGSMRAAKKGGEHGHELKIRRPGGPARLRSGAASRYPTAAGNGAWAARRRRARAGKTAGHGASTPKATHRRRGRAVPRIWFEQNETFAWSRSMSETMLSCSACSSTRSSPPTRSRACSSVPSDGVNTG